ncbi:MAG: hypothetical protein ACP5DX_08645 [Paracoccaceae bacterium]
MDFLDTITFDQIAYSLFAFALIRTLLVAFLPDRVAGPGGWLIDTGQD